MNTPSLNRGDFIESAAGYQSWHTDLVQLVCNIPVADVADYSELIWAVHREIDGFANVFEAVD